MPLKRGWGNGRARSQKTWARFSGGSPPLTSASEVLVAFEAGDLDPPMGPETEPPARDTGEAGDRSED